MHDGSSMFGACFCFPGGMDPVQRYHIIESIDGDLSSIMIHDFFHHPLLYLSSDPARYRRVMVSVCSCISLSRNMSFARGSFNPAIARFRCPSPTLNLTPHRHAPLFSSRPSALWSQMNHVLRKVPDHYPLSEATFLSETIQQKGQDKDEDPRLNNSFYNHPFSYDFGHPRPPPSLVLFRIAPSAQRYADTRRKTPTQPCLPRSQVRPLTVL